MAGKPGKSGGSGKSGGKAVRGRVMPQHNLAQVYMKMVTSETCIACKSRCARGIEYMKQMEKPGAVGRGVPCILTGYKISG